MTLEAWVTLILVFVRVGALMVSMPVVSTQGVPRFVPVLLAVAITALVGPVVPVTPMPATVGHLVLGVAGEVATGLVLGLGATAVFASITVAAEVMDMQMGFGSLTSLDPVQKATEGALGALASLLAAGLFIGADLHLSFLFLLADSLRVVPPGTAGMPVEAIGGITVLVGQSISLGVQLAGPVVVFLFLVQVFIAILARMAPRMNVFFSVGMSVSNIAGIVVVALALAWILPVHHEAVRSAMVFSAGWLR